MTVQERQDKLVSYGKAPEQLRKALGDFPKEVWKYKPAPNRWSIHEIIIHLADAEANCYIRARRFVAEPGKAVMAYDQDSWAEKLGYHSQSADAALELFGLLRRMNHGLLKSVPQDVWDSHTVEHSEVGTMTLDQFLEIYDRHTPGHIRQMQENYRHWKEHRK
ncbi:MAG: DinB family protein [Candidatus Zixiibacteriota bacterium]